MHRWLVLSLTVLLSLVVTAACSNNSQQPVLPDTKGDLTSATSSFENGNSFLLGYYDVYFDIGTAEFEVIENRTASFTLNIVPFLNQMTIPQNGITFDSIVLHQDDPSFLGVDVEFSIYHPFPGYDQYDAYDLRGIIIGDGADTLMYDGLRTARHGTDLWMKNPDGYTRWFNPTEFTSELIFGYVPGGWQNYAGNATLNPYKYYAKHLQKDDDLWAYLTGDNNWDGIFESGAGRNMELEFPLPPDGLGIRFGYAVVVCWEDQGSEGPFYPVHVPEPVAISVTVTPDIWYNEIDGSGGDLILDLDLFAWENQPDSVKIESSVLDSVVEFDYETYASPGGDHYSTWHVEASAKQLHTADDHYFRVIAEYENLGYSNDFPDIPHPLSPLAAFFRSDLEIGSGPGNQPPDCDITSDPEVPYSGSIPVTITFDASGSSDPDADVLTFAWDTDNDGNFDDGFNPTVDVMYDTEGTYTVCVKVSDGISESICCISDFEIIDETVWKNIPLRNNFAAYDVAVIHDNGDILILYSDDQVWKYPADTCYQSGELFYTVNCDSPSHDFHPTMMDCNRLGVAILGHTATNVMWTWHYDSDGNKLGEYGLCGACTGNPKLMPDVTAFANNGAYHDHLAVIAGGNPGTYETNWWYNYGPEDTYNSFNGQWASLRALPGITYFDHREVIALEGDINGDDLWLLEGPPENKGTRWTNGSGGVYAITYDGSYFPSSSDLVYWHSPVDLTRDENNRLLMLDENSGQGIISAWIPGAAGGTYESEVGDPTTISEQPRAVDGSDYDGKMFVIHGDTYNSTTGYKLSIFFPDELP